MRNKKTLAIAASIITLTLAATPHRAAAAFNGYLYVDGVKHEASVQNTPSLSSTVLTVLLSIVGL